VVFPTGTPCSQVAINAANPLVRSPPNGPLAISQLGPLAFAPGAAVTQVGDPAAKRFLYAAVIAGSDGQPEVLDIVLDDTLNTNKQFSKGLVITFSLPLVILKQDDSEIPVAATLKLTATCNGAANCLTGTVTGVPVTGASPPSAAQLGIQFDTSFVTSPNSSTAHRQWELQIPIVATPDNDGAYFARFLTCPNGNGANALSGYCNAFSRPARGFVAPVLGSGASIGIAPYAAPLCTPATCPTKGTAQTLYFGFCASVANAPVAATFVHIGTDGTTVATTPVSTQKLQCPATN
jgi:hypothetical protein